MANHNIPGSKLFDYRLQDYKIQDGGYLKNKRIHPKKDAAVKERLVAAGMFVPGPIGGGDVQKPTFPEKGIKKRKEEEETEAETEPDVINSDLVFEEKRARQLMRQVSGLGMEDPVFRSSDHSDALFSDDNVEEQKPWNFFDDMGIDDMPADMRDMVSVASDPTASVGSSFRNILSTECVRVSRQPLIYNPYDDDGDDDDDDSKSGSDLLKDAMKNIIFNNEYEKRNSS